MTPPGNDQAARVDLMLVNSAAFFATEQRGLLRNYLPYLNLMYLVAYLRSAHPELAVEVIDPEVFYTEVDDVDAALEPIVTGVDWQHGAERSRAVRRANNAMYFFMASRAQRARDRLRADLRRARPRVVGVPFHYSSAYSQSEAVLAIVRESVPDAVVVAGGTHATSLPEQLLEEQPSLDVVIRGEAERPLAAIVRAARAGDLAAQLPTIPGLVFRSGNDVRSTGVAELIEDLDAIPHPYTVADEFQIAKRRELFFRMPWLQEGFWSSMQEDPAGVFLTSRGCPYDCSFCANALMSHRRVRAHSVDYVAEMVRASAERFDLRSANFSDAIFGIGKQRTRELCERLASHRLGWHCQTRADLLDEDRVQSFATLGMRSVAIGAESFNREALRLAHKQLDPAKLRVVVRLLREHGIKPIGTFVVGLPGDDRASVLRSARVAREIGFEAASFFPASAVVGSRLFEELQHTVPRHRWRARWVERKDVLYTGVMSKTELFQVAREAQAVFDGASTRGLWRGRLKLLAASFVYDVLPRPVGMRIDRMLRRHDLI